jgi:hypothetical protein
MKRKVRDCPRFPKQNMVKPDNLPPQGIPLGRRAFLRQVVMAGKPLGEESYRQA